ncbi:efflux transporter outer membrane subunit [Methylococcus sp. EFPC2]|uniref:efflux transporter outer membrane subunit n=1 Tax=Methylococcus sp. EFPC2 TaxID=2812648 RepID=UPI001967D086|nr:efflux transporter outer membrane subunit [Methylococcus sp. EFPC2]QSA96535.1 efflux transporter outer membrane subunit [Methylococcus sp. EFPC2]
MKILAVPAPLLIPVIVALTACTPTRVDNKLPLPAVPHYSQSGDTPTTVDPWALSSWWKGFRDPVLDALIADALAANHDIKIAKSRVREAKSMITIAESALYPSLEISGSGGREKSLDRVFAVPGQRGVELIAPAGNLISGGLAARWEVDLFGGRQLEAEAVSAQAEGSREAERSVLVGVLAQVATNYLELRGTQARAENLRRRIDLQQQRLKVVRAFSQAGRATEWEVARQQALLYGTEATLPALDNAIAALTHRLTVLTGKPPEQRDTRLAFTGRRLATLPTIPNLLPSALLDQRPDMRLAKTQLDAAAASLGSARADLYPKVVLSASGGLGTLATGGMPTLAETVYALGAGLSAPIFNAGRIRAHIAAQDAKLEQAAANYEKTFLLALEDVENAYVALRSSQQRQQQSAQAEAAADAAHRHAQAFFERGVADVLAVLDAEHIRLDMYDESIKADTAVSVGLVSLYRALGGGWDLNDAPEARAP